MHRSLVFTFAAIATLALTRPAQADVTVFENNKIVDFKLDMYGWVMPRFTWQASDDRPVINLHPNAAFTIQRARLGTYARLGKWARVQMEVELGREIAQPIDAFVVLSPLHGDIATLNLQVGQFRVPFSRQNLIQGVGLQLPDAAYHVRPSFIVDRDIGGMLWGELFDGRARWNLGMFNGNDPGRGQTLNSDRHFLFAARLEASPLGRPPRFEGDLRPMEDQSHPLVTVGVSAMRNRLEDKHFNRNYIGADIGAWWKGASIYGELYYHVDDPTDRTGPNATARVRQLGWNVQAGYFLPLPWVREHLEIVARAEYLDPNMDVKTPANDNGARDLDASNPTWGFMGFQFGANYYLFHTHQLKAQVVYELRNETKRCLEGQMGSDCTGYISNNLFIAQITAGF
ncbi:Phosphate-specific outer membrane porin OprP [Minicystis rosea]|nr:Phosphate-specific outer membrane porin OprP [Minicystis rosea]